MDENAVGRIWGNETLVTRVSTHHLIKILPAEACETLLKAGLVRAFERGAAVMNEGDSGNLLLLVLDGHALVTSPHDGAELARLGPGALLGEVEIFSGEPRIANVHAEDTLVVACFAGDVVRGLAAEFAAFDRLLRKVGDHRRSDAMNHEG